MPHLSPRRHDMRKLATLGVYRDCLDRPFAGSCTVAVACARTGRRSVSIEICEKYFRIGVDRMKREAARTPLFDPPRPTQRSLI